MSTEDKELELCGKVEMRIALAKDDKLESILKPYLAPLLLKLASEHVSVRNKVISICQHIKIRLAGNQNIVLPVAALLKQYKENAGNSIIRQFDLMFIQQSIKKLSFEEQQELIPVIIKGLSSEYGNLTCSTMFNLFLRLLSNAYIPLRGSKDDMDLRDKLGLAKNDVDANFIALWLGKLILLNIDSSRAAGVSHSGLTASDYEFLTINDKQGVWDATSNEGLNLTQTKIIALKFLASGAFTDKERFFPAFFASGDSNSSISSIGIDLLKRSSASMEDPEIVSYLLDIYFSLRKALQTRVLILLNKSILSTTFPFKIVQIVREAIRPDDTTNAPVKGLETIKFRNALLSYLNWMSQVASRKDLASAAPQLVELLQSYIEDQGWPVPHDKTPDTLSLRALAYETLGSLAKTTPSLVLKKDLGIVKWLYKSLTEEISSPEIIISIESALSMIRSAFIIPLDLTLRDELRGLLLKYMILQEGGAIIRSARFSTVRWANYCLEYNDIVGRWINILAIGGFDNERSDIVEEGKKGLDPYLYRILNPSQSSSKDTFPDWRKSVKVIFSSESILENSITANSLKTGMSIDSVSVFGNFSGQRINAFAPAVTYCAQILFLTALKNSATSLTINADWERQLCTLFDSDKRTLEAIRTYVRLVDQDALQTILTAAFEGMLWNDGNGLSNCGKCFLDIIKVSPKTAIEKLSGRAFQLLTLIKSNNVATRFIGAQSYGILISHPGNEKEVVIGALQSLLTGISQWETAFGADENKVHGYLLALGFFLSRLSFFNRKDVLSDALVKRCCLALVEILQAAKNSSTKEAVSIAVGEISAAGLLCPSQLGDMGAKVIKIFISAAKTGDKRSISALARFSLVFADNMTEECDIEAPLFSILAGLYELSNLKQTEIQFTVGEAISCLTACWESDVLILGMDVDTTYTGHPRRKDLLDSVLQKLIGDCKATKPSLKKASGIWLFSLIQHCGHLEEIQNRLRECQVAFMRLLSARDEIVQETASRGLSLVYEQGDACLKESLVKDLVSSFTETSTRLKVDDDTELFDPGALPTGEGNSVTSYKDIISLANEVGDQTLVYKFMSLASNAATWTTRAAFGRYGLSSILSDSEIDSKLCCKLYRYRFDPNPNVRRSMDDIWKAIIKDPSATIKLYCKDIISDLLQSILGKEWRTRQASCAALSSLIQGREFEDYDNYLPEIWHVAFKVLDDIKGSVREAAHALSVVLTNTLVRQVESGTISKHSQSILKEVIPFLLSEQGMENSAQDVRVFSTVTIIRLTKKGGKTLLTYIPALVEKLLLFLSSIEPQEINYLYQRASEHRDKIDQMRSNTVSQSPLMEAIDCCLDALDEPTMAHLASRLQLCIKTMIGMPSKIGCASVLSNLATRHSYIFRPHADVFLKCMEKAVLDRNSTVSVAYAKSMGYISRLASDEVLLHLASYVQNLYLTAEDETQRIMSGEIVYAVAKFSTDRFNSLASSFLPFVFFASHDLDSEVREHFEKTWNENIGGSRAVMLYSKEIIQLSTKLLDSPIWSTKHAAAFTVAHVIQSSGSEITGLDAVMIWDALEKALALKTFEGKEKILQAFVKFVKSGRLIWEKDEAIAARMRKIVLREARRNNELYRPHAFACLGDFCEARRDIDMYDEIFQIIKSFINDLDSNPKSQDSSIKTEKDRGSFSTSANLVAGISSVFRAVNFTLAESPGHQHLPCLLQLVQDVTNSLLITESVRFAIFESTTTLFDTLRQHAGTVNQSSELMGLGLKFFTVLNLPQDLGSEATRLKRAEAADMIVQSLGAGGLGNLGEGWAECRMKMIETLKLSQANERSAGVTAVFGQLRRRLESI
ncbi:unnamed protein product [Blumeria hordei]|uniref:Proteasome component ECM29 n=1 Tax=Blumeria hordei TaxID=2867405 RepID=A0A383UTY6_BLUHO|nr:unnamed protein product [Blumeria hordei]